MYIQLNITTAVFYLYYLKGNKIITHKHFFILAFLIFLLSSYFSHVSTTQAKEPHGIILISLDTLRADHLGTYGYHRNTSPAIDAFAKESVIFENAVVQSPWTLPSHMSIMTSLYPSFHQVVEPSFSLADEHVTLAELIKKGGYQTAAFTDGGYVNTTFGFNQGFDIYEDQRIGIANIIPKVKKWLDINKSEPFFLFIHCYDIHSPYNPPLPYNSTFHDFAYTGSLIPSTNNILKAKRNKIKVDDEDLRHLIALYDGGIRYTDEKIGAFLNYLKDDELYDQSLIIITSDHGEEFREHNRFGHGQTLYYRPDLHVPLIIRIPNFPKKEIKISELVQSIDLLPTILDIAKLPAHPPAQGKSLLSLMKRHKNFLNYSLWRIFHPFTKESTVAFAEGGNPNQASIIRNGYQIIYNPESSSVELFNIKTDPVAQDNIANDHKDISEQLLYKWQKLYSDVSNDPSSTIEIDQRTRTQLEALGYVDFQDNASETTKISENEGIAGNKDNCPFKTNPEQKDTDGDGKGDACDNCPLIVNVYQRDADEDLIGDACDDCIDTDWDGYGNSYYPNKCEKDNCPAIFNPLQEDSDEDGKGDFCDNCSHYYNPTQDDFDRDGIGDECDNCFDRANASKGGTCLGGMNDGWHCFDDELCGSNAFCSMDQEDTYPPQGNGIGDACECEADFDCDGDVDEYDLETFMTNYNQSTLDKPASAIDLSKGDFDCDLDVDDKDRIKFLEDFGRNSSKNPCPACEVGDWCSY